MFLTNENKIISLRLKEKRKKPVNLIDSTLSSVYKN